MRVEDILSQNARRFPSKLLAKMGTAERTYEEIEERSNRLANVFLERGISRGERVVVILPNCLEMIEIMFASAKADAVMVPVNPKHAWPEIRYVLQDCRPLSVITDSDDVLQSVGEGEGRGEDEQFLVSLRKGAVDSRYFSYGEIVSASPSHWQPIKDRSEWDPWVLGYTSGTTGRPKPVSLTHRSKTLCAFVEALEFGTTDSDIVLMNTPMFHLHGLVHVLSVISVGGSVVLQGRFGPEGTLEIIEKEKVTELSMVPSMYRKVLEVAKNRPVDLSSVRLARSTGEHLPEKLKDEISANFPKNSLNLLYGATEAGPVTNLRPEFAVTKAGSVGLPFLGVEIQIRDGEGNPLPPNRDGEIFIRSAYIGSVYSAETENEKGGRYERWITLGDYGCLDDDGFLYLRGRSGDTIISGGKNISVREVELTLAKHPGVKDVAVIGVPDSQWGERVRAYVELRAGMEMRTEDMIRFCEGRLARFKQPREIRFLKALPRNEMGKIEKGKLK